MQCLSRALSPRADRAAAQWAASHARVAANRIFALEHSGLPLLQLAGIARRELASGGNPAQATLDSLALAAIAAQRTLGMRPHLPQLAAALLVLQDRAVEMPPGEGKTLALALAAVVRALAGMPVHVVVRDASRASEDARALRSFYQALGITVATLRGGSLETRPTPSCAPDVCYGGLRDLVLVTSGMSDVALAPPAPEAACALVDDLDGILVDGAADPVALPAGSGRSACLVQADGQDAAEATGPTAQAWFGRYRHLGGVSATLEEARRELAAVYGLGVTSISSIYPSFRNDRPLQVVVGRKAWQEAVVARVAELVRGRRAVVVGVAQAEGGAALVQALRAAGLAVDLAGAATGAAAGAAAGAPASAGPGSAGAVTICENPAACADIVPDPVARAAGGLAVLATALGETRRADRRWRHLAGRRGQPGSTEAIVALPAALGGEHAWLPAGLVRLLILARRNLLEWRASSDRRRRARGRSIAPAAEPPTAWPQGARLQHEGH